MRGCTVMRLCRGLHSSGAHLQQNDRDEEGM
jgi:hypothetical protein